MSSVNARILNSPVTGLKLINVELDLEIVSVESKRLYESTQLEGKDVATEKLESINTFRGVAKDVTYP